AMVNTIVRECDVPPRAPELVDDLPGGSRRTLAAVLTAVENGILPDPLAERLDALAAGRQAPVLGITGTGGSGKSSLTDELVLRLRRDPEDQRRVAVLAVDPNRRRAVGALLGDR